MLLIVGTDTDVGKTWTGCALARALCRGGRRVVAVKPVETGCPGAPAETEDGVALARATGQAEPLHALLRFRDVMDLAQAVDAPVLLVAQDRLGTISHTLMELKVLELSRLEVVGVVLTAPEQPDASAGSNGAAMVRSSGCARPLCVPRTHDPAVTSGCIQEATHWSRIA